MRNHNNKNPPTLNFGNPQSHNVTFTPQTPTSAARFEESFTNIRTATAGVVKS